MVPVGLSELVLLSPWLCVCLCCPAAGMFASADDDNFHMLLETQHGPRQS